jgi:PAS domain S-box-containing protein
MGKDVLRNASLPALLAGGFIVLDLALDRYLGGPGRLGWPHLFLAVSVLLVSYILVSRAVGGRRRAEAVLRQARDEMESRVRERTAELAQTNEALRVEVAERKRIEQSLRASEETARALMNASSESALLLDAQGVVLACNETVAQRLGVTVDHLVGSLLLDFFPPEVAEKRRTYLNAILHSRQPIHFVDERDGRTFDNHVYPVLDADGRIIRLAVFGQDTTERMQVEEALRESEGRYRTLFDNFPEPATVWSRDGALLMQNMVSARNLGGKREDYLGKTIYDIFGETAATYMERIARVIDTGILEEREDVVELHFGKRHFWTWMQRIQNTDGQYAVQAISYDITERAQTQAALQEANQRLELTQAAAGIGSWDWDILSDRLEWSAKMFDLFGLHRRTTIASFDAWWSVVHPEDREAAERQITLALETHSELADEYRIMRPDGQICWISVLGRGLYDEQDRPFRMSGICLDITKRKRSEEVLRRAQADLAIGTQERIALEERQRLARELHDSVSQALYGVSLGVNTALTLFDMDRTKVLEALNYALSLTHAGLTEMRALIFELRTESLEMEGLVVALTKQVDALRARAGIEGNLSLCGEPDVPLAIKEALYGIGREAMHNAVKHARPQRLDVRLTREPESLCLEVCDNGIGFDPLAAYPGHLGLRSMRERAQSVDGMLEIVSAPGRGTQIRARIPFVAPDFAQAG